MGCFVYQGSPFFGMVMPYADSRCCIVNMYDVSDVVVTRVAV